LKSELAVTLMMLLMTCAIACHKQSVNPGIPVPAAYLKQADIAFEKADFGRAVAAYENYVRGTPQSKDYDRALFRLAIAYAVPGHPSQNAARSTELLNRLIDLFPQSPLRPQAEYILHLQSESRNVKGLQESNQDLQADLEKTKASVKERDERIRLLREELNRLKKIDLERRPRRPPNK
jgi:outer membrane protein assembly factor BamD (BamD/ComL family)